MCMFVCSLACLLACVLWVAERKQGPVSHAYITCGTHVHTGGAGAQDLDPSPGEGVLDDDVRLRGCVRRALIKGLKNRELISVWIA